MRHSNRLRYSIVPATITHVHQLAPRLRDGDRAEIEAAGLEPRRCLRGSFQAAIVRHTVFVFEKDARERADGDGEIAAMWGLGGVLLGDVGQPWLLTAPAIERVPLAFVKEARAQVAVMLALKPVLRNHVAADYAKAIGLLKMLGFRIAPPEPFGPRGALFREFELRREWASIQ